MIPERFVVEYPARCLQLLDLLEPTAKQLKFLGSFGFLVAAAVLVIPFERMQPRHPMSRQKGGDLAAALKRLSRSGTFSTAMFWNGQSSGEWRMSRVMTDPDDTVHWRDPKGHHPMSLEASNQIDDHTPGDVLRVFRNALAHGNVVYLNEHGFETKNTPVCYLGFLSRYEESEEQRKAAETYRLVVTTEEDFIHFVKSWATWVASLQPEIKFSKAA